MSETVIFHIDVNSAFLSWEAAYRVRHLGDMIDLREIPSAIGGSEETRHGIILAKSIPAKVFHIKTGESLMEARRKCPTLTIIPPNYHLYETCSRAFMGVLREYSPDVEQYSIDEAFVDMTGTRLLFGEPLEVANQIRERIRQELGFTVNIGISSNKLLAKMASDFKKPNRVHTLFPEEVSEKMWPLPVTDLFFVGRATAMKCYSLGIYTIGELARTQLSVLTAHLKKQGEVIWNFANGLDCGEVQPTAPPNKGYGNSTTIRFDVTDAETAKMVLLSLAETVSARLRHAKVKILLVSVSVKNSEFYSSSHQRYLSAPTNVTNEIYEAACALFDELWDGEPIRHLGIHTSQVREETAARQLSFFDTMDYQKLESVEKAVDKIRLRYGNESMKRAVFLAKDE